MTNDRILSQDAEFRYALLDRMKQDCQYYLTYGNRNVDTLWASSEQDQIDTMKALWNCFPADQKPEWLTMEQIQSFEKRMLHAVQSPPLTKEVLTHRLRAGATIEELFVLSPGQECTIFKTVFTPGDTIIYIPDLALNSIPSDSPIPEANIEDIVHSCYTGNDFLALCDGNMNLARYLFWYCDWQHPSSALPEIDDAEDPKSA